MVAPTQAIAAAKPNILVIWGDDIGYWNLSYNNRGMMGYNTPNIDRLAREGVAFTDYYGQQSCTAGRAAFITGQNPIRTGLTKVGMPGAQRGNACPRIRPSLTLLKAHWAMRPDSLAKTISATWNEMLPSVPWLRRVLWQPVPPQLRGRAGTGRLSAIPGFHEQVGPRGVLHTYATDEDDPTTHPRWERSENKKSRTRGR